MGRLEARNLIPTQPQDDPRSNFLLTARIAAFLLELLLDFLDYLVSVTGLFSEQAEDDADPRPRSRS